MEMIKHNNLKTKLLNYIKKTITFLNIKTIYFLKQLFNITDSKVTSFDVL